MSYLSVNIRYLRAQLNKSQQALASELLITRGRYAKYEDGTSEPPLEILMRISRFFHVSIDLILSVDLRKVPLDQIMELPDNRIVFPIKVDSQGQNCIEIIPHKAQMGYLSSYSDPEYIENLSTISIPFLRNGKFRAFPTEGDSMPPHQPGSLIIGRYIESLQDLKVGQTYIWVTRNEGISYKRLQQITSDALLLSSDNPIYSPYWISLQELVEVWHYSCSLATTPFDPPVHTSESMHLIELIQDLKQEVLHIKTKLNS